ncbi:hypothetical protein FRC04_002367 [Tulasnella sp. 424]|nr:hypothetical protein FRC04_002367 [Tulasnella sp. 424]KAG8977440.1 hypothetical protein FRC05_001838 [Tulasnella sp. 425]
MSTGTPLLPLTRETASNTASLTLTRTSPPSRIRLGRFSPNRLSLTRRYSSPPASPTSPTADTSVSGRLKALIKTYGWYALGVYFLFGIVDFAIAFGLINILGADQVSKWTAAIKAYVKDNIYSPAEPGAAEVDKAAHHAAQGGHEGLYAMIVLAYTVHKTLFLPFRVGLTAAFTPKIVNWLASRGWAGRAGTVRAATHMRDRIRTARGKGKIDD